MEYKKYTSKKTTSFICEGYFYWKGEVEKELDVQSPPTSYNALVFNLGDLCYGYQHNNKTLPIPQNFVCGQFTNNYHLVIKGEIEMVGIIFKPTAMYNLFKLRMSNLVNNRMPLEHVLGGQALKIYNSLKKEPEPALKINILKKLIETWSEKAKVNLTIIDDTIEYIDERIKNITVQEVVDHFHLSKRYFEIKFLEKVGVSPKMYIRLKRISTLCYQALYQNESDWQEIVNDFGFYDQAHFIKEFNKFNFTSPAKYKKDHNELIRFVKNENVK
ncbi:MAG: AraC family transcriptional regulator [Cyclobacteriaceae bacterium]|nr:AraC family transcriptional regulator [Cyclobacteriaceae bacterium]